MGAERLGNFVQNGSWGFCVGEAGEKKLSKDRGTHEGGKKKKKRSLINDAEREPPKDGGGVMVLGFYAKKWAGGECQNRVWRAKYTEKTGGKNLKTSDQAQRGATGTDQGGDQTRGTRNP